MMFRRKKRVQSGPKFGTEICRALGIDPNYTRKLTITIEAGQLPIVDAVLYVKDLENGKPSMAQILSRYKFTEVE